MNVVHPITGEILPDDLEKLVEQERVVDGFLRSLRVHYAFRGNLRARIAELRGIADLPPLRWRTSKQNRVGCCPRCGHGESLDVQVEGGPDVETSPYDAAAA